MVKKLLSLATVLLMTCCLANAQKIEKYGKSTGLTFKKMAPPTALTRAAGQDVVFTYAEGTGVSAVGVQQNAHYDCAIFIPGEYAGNTINGVAFYIIDKSVVSNVSCWIDDKLPGNAPTDCNFSQNVNAITDDVLTTGYPVVVESEYTVPDGGCYVGYSFDAVATSEYGAYPIAVDGMADKQGGMFINFDNTRWDNYYGQGFGNLLTAVVMSGDNFPGNAVTLNSTDFGKVIASLNGVGNVRISFTSKGVNPVTSLSYVVDDVNAARTASEEKTVAVDNVGFLGTGYVTFSVDAAAEQGLLDKKITITKVNGATPEGDGVLTATGNLLTVSKDVKRKVVVEEFTGTGCPYCTRGYAGMSALEDKYPYEFIGIAAHSSMNYPDPMENDSYISLMYSLYSFGLPSALLNRSGNMTLYDPYFGSSTSTLLGIYDDFEALCGSAEAEVTVNPVWSEDGKNVNINTDVTFLWDATDKYALAYVLVEDGLHGDDYYWWQYNYLYGASGYENEPYLYEWTQRGEFDNAVFGSNAPFVKDMVYDHVALDSKNILGTETNLTAPIVSGQVQSHETTFDLSNGIKGYYLGNDLIQDRSKLKVVAMLINTSTGEIVNADEKPIAEYESTGISNITATDENATEVARYSLDGARLSAPVKGINIIKMSDGTTKKVVVE